jgi:radical SAM protein with 4Fe4S-binding SPASM domain
MLENTVTTFIKAGGGKHLSSRRVLYHLPERLFGYDILNQTIIQTHLSPVSVALCPTPFCVRECKFCSNAQRNRKNKKSFFQLSPEVFNRVVDNLTLMKVQGVSIAGGGEPLVYSGPILDGLILKSDIPFRIGIHTNGVVLKKILLREVFAGKNVSYINVSVVAHNPSLYSLVCGVSESQFFAVERNIVDMLCLAREVNSGILPGVKILLCRENYSFAFNIFDYLRQLGVENILIRCVGNFEPKQNIELFPEQVNNLIPIFRNKIGMNEDQIMAVLGMRYNIGFLPMPSRCWICALQYTAGVDPDGEVYLCSPWSRKEYSIGNVNELDIQRIWGSKRHKEVARMLNNNLRSGKCNPLLCRHYYSNLAIDSFISGDIQALPITNYEKGYGRFI